MRTQLLTRTQAIKLIGLTPVIEVEKLDCDFTGRVMEPHEIDWEEFSAYHATKNGNRIKVYYYQRKDDVADCASLCDLTWKPAGYEVDIIN